MRLPRLLLLSLLASLASSAPSPQPQRGGFELPVQLVGFPVIIIAVRISRFVKQLSYALNPQTYRSSGSRQTRDLHDLEAGLDVAEVEKRMVAEMGEHVCVYERVCAQYAQIAQADHQDQHVIDWNGVFSKYSSAPDQMKQFYLLSVFLGDIVGSPDLCHKLAKRGRGCGGDLEATA